MLKESETLELKASLGEWKEAVIALAAFANKKGGRVIIGVDDRGEPSFTEKAGAFVVAFRPRGNGGINSGINGGINRALDFIRANEGLRAHQIAGALGMPPDTVEKQLRALKKTGKIAYRGSKKTGGYYAAGQEPNSPPPCRGRSRS